MFDSIFTNGTVQSAEFFIVLAVSIIAGAVFSLLCSVKSTSSKSFSVCVGLIPMAVAVVIELVNGNLGVGVAIAGAFGLVRFRSAQGTAKEIAAIFVAMASGLAFGMGFMAYGVIVLLVAGAIILVCNLLMNKPKKASLEKIIKITIPESLDYTTVFDDIFGVFTTYSDLESVKSVNMGSMFRLSYRVKLKSREDEKMLIDAIRTRNGNLEIQCSRADMADHEL